MSDQLPGNRDPKYPPKPQGQGQQAPPGVGDQPPGEGESPTTQERLVTQDQLQKAFQVWGEEWRQSLAKAFGGIQSHTDKFMDKVDQRVNDLTNALKGQGVEVDEKMTEALRQQAMLDALDDSPDPQPGSQDLSSEKVLSAADTLMQAAGIYIYEGDPETKFLDEVAEGTPKEYLEGVQKAIAAKAERTGQNPPQNIQTNPPQTTIAQNFTKVPGAVQGQRGSNPIAHMNTVEEVWAEIERRGIFK